MRALLFPLLLAGCSSASPADVTGCRAYFAIFTTDIQLPDGSPADSVRVTATNRRTGITYGPCDGSAALTIGCPFGDEPSHYIVYTDAQLDETSERGDDVTVRGTLNARAFQADFRFRRDRCHVYQVAGPDTVTLR